MPDLYQRRKKTSSKFISQLQRSKLKFVLLALLVKTLNGGETRALKEYLDDSPFVGFHKIGAFNNSILMEGKLREYYWKDSFEKLLNSTLKENFFKEYIKNFEFALGEISKQIDPDQLLSGDFKKGVCDIKKCISTLHDALGGISDTHGIRNSEKQSSESGKVYTKDIKEKFTMKFCRECGKNLIYQAKFCIRCGKKQT